MTILNILKAVKTEIASGTGRVSHAELWSSVVKVSRQGLRPAEIIALEKHIKTRTLGEEMNSDVPEEMAFKAIEDCNDEATMWYWLENMTPTRDDVVDIMTVAIHESRSTAGGTFRTVADLDSR